MINHTYTIFLDRRTRRAAYFDGFQIVAVSFDVNNY